MIVTLQDRRRMRTAALAAAAAMAAMAAVPAAAESVATVNGEDISRSVFDVYLRSQTGGKSAAEATEEEKAAALRGLQDLYLLADQAESQKLDQQEDVRAQLELQRKAALAQTLAQRYLQQNAASEEELKAEYERQLAASSQKQYKARHILLEQESEARTVIAELEGGADFATLAKEKSVGPSGPQGGELDWFPPDSMVQPFSDAVVALKDGQYTKTPVQTRFGWHVILREGSKEVEPPAFEEVRTQLNSLIGQRRLQGYVQGLRAGAELESSL